MATLSPSVQEALQFEASCWTNGSVMEDEFYHVPKDTVHVLPGTSLKVEDTDPSRYLLPPCIAMTRLLYMSETVTGTRVPVSAFVLWPFSPKNHGDGFQIVAWAHGTSGITSESAPSNHKFLWQHFLAPYQLATQGYVVVATDYAGLGVHKTSSGEPIVHQYMACPSHANDVMYAVQAAREAFPELSKRFVVIGHSQGGGAAWATAQRQTQRPVDGYLGAIAIAPVTDVLKQVEPLVSSLIGTAMCPGIASVFPEFKYTDVLTPEGQQCLAAVEKSKAGLASLLDLFSDAQLMKDSWTQNRYIQQYNSMVCNGGKQISGPILVIDGGGDARLSTAMTTAAIDETAEGFPDSRIDYYILPSVSHVGTLQGSQRIWMEWIADRFSGCEVNRGCRSTVLTPARAIKSYQTEQNWYLESATKPFHAP